MKYGQYVLYGILLAVLSFSVAGAVDIGDMRKELFKGTGYPVGSVAQLEGTQEIYIMVPVKRAAHVPSVAVFQCLGLQAKQRFTITRNEMKGLKKSPLLLKGPDGKVYEISGEQKRHLASPAAMQRRGYDPASVLPATDAQLNCIKSGPPLN